MRGFLGVVSQPGTLSHIEMGWVWLPGPGGGWRDVSIRTIASICPGGEQGTKEAVQECQLEPWHLGEGGTDPGDYGFRFRAGGRWFNVQVVLVLLIPWYCIVHSMPPSTQVEVQDRGRAYFGEEWESRIVERFCR